MWTGGVDIIIIMLFFRVGFVLENFLRKEIPVRNGNGKIPAEHWAMIPRIAQKMYRRARGAVDVEELIQEGVIGYLQVVSRLDKAKDSGHEGFFAIRVRGTMLDSLRREDMLSKRGCRVQQTCARKRLIAYGDNCSANQR